MQVWIRFTAWSESPHWKEQQLSEVLRDGDLDVTLPLVSDVGDDMDRSSVYAGSSNSSSPTAEQSETKVLQDCPEPNATSSPLVKAPVLKRSPSAPVILKKPVRMLNGDPVWVKGKWLLLFFFISLSRVYRAAITKYIYILGLGISIVEGLWKTLWEGPSWELAQSWWYGQTWRASGWAFIQRPWLKVRGSPYYCSKHLARHSISDQWIAQIVMMTIIDVAIDDGNFVLRSYACPSLDI